MTFFSAFVKVDNNKCIVNGIGARKGLIGKTGEMPARSRHCNGEQIQEMPLGRKPWEGLGERRSRARRTACLTITAIPTKDGDGDSGSRTVCYFIPTCRRWDFIVTAKGMKKNKEWN